MNYFNYIKDMEKQIGINGFKDLYFGFGGDKSYEKYISECDNPEENRKRRICSIYATH